MYSLVEKIVSWRFVEGQLSTELKIQVLCHCSVFPVYPCHHLCQGPEFLCQLSVFEALLQLERNTEGWHMNTPLCQNNSILLTISNTPACHLGYLEFQEIPWYLRNYEVLKFGIFIILMRGILSTIYQKFLSGVSVPLNAKSSRR